MVNPGTFQGSRGEFLLAQSAIYASAVADGCINDVVSDIQRRYLKRYPMSLPHDQEPAQEWLDQVDDDTPDPDSVEPDYDPMDADLASALKVEREKEAELLRGRKDAIKRRLHYIYSKSRNDKSLSCDKVAHDPVSALRARLTGIDTKYPRKKTPFNAWGPKNRKIVDPVFNKRITDLGAGASQHAAIRSAVYKELFETQPAATQEHWANVTAEEHNAAIREIDKKRKQGVSISPHDRQRVIAALPKIIEPVLDMLAEHTGWKISLAAGGPEPADGGRLNMILIHSGVMPGTIKMDFGAAERDAFKNHLIPTFGRYLKKSYTVTECRSRALPGDHTCTSLNDVVVDDEDQIHLHTFEVDDEHRAASQAAAQKGKRAILEEFASKGKKTSRPQTGKPSPPVRFVPPLGKPIPNRVPPTSDGHARHHPAYVPSPLSRDPVTAGQLNGVKASVELRPNQHTEAAAPAGSMPAHPPNAATTTTSTGTSTSTSASTLAASLSMPIGPSQASLPITITSTDTNTTSGPSIPARLSAALTVLSQDSSPSPLHSPLLSSSHLQSQSHSLLLSPSTGLSPSTPASFSPTPNGSGQFQTSSLAPNTSTTAPLIPAPSIPAVSDKQHTPASSRVAPAVQSAAASDGHHEHMADVQGMDTTAGGGSPTHAAVF